MKLASSKRPTLTKSSRWTAKGPMAACPLFRRLIFRVKVLQRLQARLTLEAILASATRVARHTVHVSGRTHYVTPMGHRQMRLSTTKEVRDAFLTVYLYGLVHLWREAWRSWSTALGSEGTRKCIPLTRGSARMYMDVGDVGVQPSPFITQFLITTTKVHREGNTC